MSDFPKSNLQDGASSVDDVDDVSLPCVRRAEATLRILEGRWKMVILAHLFTRAPWRFSQLERAIPGISSRMLAHQLRELERDGLVTRTVHPEVPPRVEYQLTAHGRALCPALDALIAWALSHPAHATPDAPLPAPAS